MKKRFLAILLCLCMAVALLPTTAFAAVTTVTIGGIDLPAGKYLASNGTVPQDIAPTSGGYAHRSADSDTLTLNDYELDYTADAMAAYGIFVDGNIELELHGTSNVSVRRDDGGTASGMAVHGNLTVTGDEGSSLTATGENGTGIYVDNDLFVTSGSLTGKGVGGVCIGAFALGNITVSGSGSLVGESSAANNYNNNHIQCYGVSAIGSITVSDNGRLEGHFKGTDEASLADFACTGVGIQANLHGGGGTITVNGGALLASAVKNAKCTNSTKALDPTLTLGAGIAAEGSGSSNGANPAAYAAEENASYLWVEASAPPAPSLVLTDNATGAPAIPGTDYNYDLAKGVLTVRKAGNYTLSMAESVTTTDHRVVVNEQDSAQVKLTLDNVHIEGAYDSLFENSGSGFGALTIVSDTVLTLSGQNSLTNSFSENSGFKANGVFLGGYASLTLTGGGSLDVNAPSGTGIFLNRSKLLHISGGAVEITAKYGVAHDTDSSGNEADFNQYKQSGGNVTITASGNTAVLSINTFALSGGSLHIGGTSEGAAINARYTTSVSGGELTIAGSYGTGIWGYKISGDEEAGKGGISFTGGVTDITLGEGGLAIYSGYSHVALNSIDTDPSSAPALPPHQITLGANMRVAEGGSVVWSNWLSEQDVATEVVWSVYDTFSADAATITDEGDVVFSGFSNRVRIEPIPYDPGPSYDYFTITATAGEGGGISPSGSVSVREGRDKTFTVTPSSGYVISDVLADGVSVKNELLSNTYTFENVYRNHAIRVTFIEESKVNPDTGAGNPFTDVDMDDWFFEDVMFAFANKLMIGTSDTTFTPYGTTTRAMVATTIWRMEGSPAAMGANGFSDVESGKWYTEAITWAAENEITEGYGGGVFGTNDPVTREQLAGFFYNYAKYKGYDTNISGNLNKFTDKDNVSDWAVNAMKWAIGYGLIEGKPGNILDPQGNATRAEFAAMLHRFIEKNELEEGITATGLMGWINPQRLNIPNTGDIADGAWPFVMFAGLIGCAALVLLKRKETA